MGLDCMSCSSFGPTKAALGRAHWGGATASGHAQVRLEMRNWLASPPQEPLSLALPSNLTASVSNQNLRELGCQARLARWPCLDPQQQCERHQHRQLLVCLSIACHYPDFLVMIPGAYNPCFYFGLSDCVRHSTANGTPLTAWQEAHPDRQAVDTGTWPHGQAACSLDVGGICSEGAVAGRESQSGLKCMHASLERLPLSMSPFPCSHECALSSTSVFETYCHQPAITELSAWQAGSSLQRR